jgi:hypothetical protein
MFGAAKQPSTESGWHEVPAKKWNYQACLHDIHTLMLTQSRVHISRYLSSMAGIFWHDTDISFTTLGSNFQ